MQEVVLSQAQAWQVYKELRRDERTFFLQNLTAWKRAGVN